MKRVAIAVFLAKSLPLMSQTVYTDQSIPGNAEIYGAGNAGLPDDNGVLPLEFDLNANPTVLTMTGVTGSISLNGGGGYNDPDGVVTSGNYSGPTIGSGGGYSVANAFGGISGITMPGAGALVGVFESDAAPSGAAPPSLDFTAIGTDFATLSPLLNQTFYIGDGLTGDGAGEVQQFIVPSGATELYLGISDAQGFDGDPGAYDDNLGTFSASFQISTAPEPSTITLGAFSAACLLARRRKNAL